MPAHTTPGSIERHRRHAVGALAFLYLIVVTGATVRLTGSGLGCPDWPSCTGARPVPEVGFHPLVEFGNRLISFPTLAFTVAAFVSARRLSTRRGDLRVATGLVLAGVVGQVVVGGMSVRYGLTPGWVSTHFLLSVAILAAATWAVHAGRRRDGDAAMHERSGTPSRAGVRVTMVVVALLLATCLATIVLGTLTTASGPHSGAEPGVSVRRLARPEVMVWLHARLAFAFTALVLAVTVWRRRTRGGARDVALLALLVVAQVGIGEWQYRTGLPWPVVLAHVANAALVWIVTCWIALDAVARARRGAPAATPATAGE